MVGQGFHGSPAPLAPGLIEYAREHGHTSSEKPTTEADVHALAAEAEDGYDVDALLARRGKPGRPSLGSGPASVESVRLDPELREELAQRAEADGTTPSEVIRQALRSYLHGALSRTPRARRGAGGAAQALFARSA
jgi:predicted transcriptional regulator